MVISLSGGWSFYTMVLAYILHLSQIMAMYIARNTSEEKPCWFNFLVVLHIGVGHSPTPMCKMPPPPSPPRDITTTYSLYTLILILCLAHTIVCRSMFQHKITDYKAITCLNAIGVLRSKHYAYCGKKACTDWWWRYLMTYAHTCITKHHNMSH